MRLYICDFDKHTNAFNHFGRRTNFNNHFLGGKIIIGSHFKSVKSLKDHLKIMKKRFYHISQKFQRLFMSLVDGR